MPPILREATAERKRRNRRVPCRCRRAGRECPRRLMPRSSREKQAMRKLCSSRALLGAAVVLGLAAFVGRAPAQRYLSGIIWPEPPVVTPGEGTAPPSDALVLFDGKNFDA